MPRAEARLRNLLVLMVDDEVNALHPLMRPFAWTVCTRTAMSVAVALQREAGWTAIREFSDHIQGQGHVRDLVA
jgi:hypothetical protein